MGECRDRTQSIAFRQPSSNESCWNAMLGVCVAILGWSRHKPPPALPLLASHLFVIIVVIIHALVSGTAAPYLSELLHPYSSSRSLRSASDTRIFRVPRMGRRTRGERYFPYI